MIQNNEIPARHGVYVRCFGYTESGISVPPGKWFYTATPDETINPAIHELSEIPAHWDPVFANLKIRGR